MHSNHTVLEMYMRVVCYGLVNIIDPTKFDTLDHEVDKEGNLFSRFQTLIYGTAIYLCSTFYTSLKSGV